MGYSSQQAKQFIEHIAPLIQREGFARGYSVVSTTIAQAIIEGACGTSKLARVYHNHFGLKCGKSWKGASVNMKTGEYYGGQYTTIKDNFRAYLNDIEGVEGYYNFISAKRYDNLREARNYRQFAEYLKADGYATSPTYVTTLCNTVQKYNLERFDERNIHVTYYPKFIGSTNSIVEALNALSVPSDVNHRRKIYNANFTDNYTMSAKQNTAMLILLKQGILIKP